MSILSLLFILTQGLKSSQDNKNVSHHSILVSGGANLGIHAVYVIGWTNNEGSAGVNDSLTATRAGHSLPIDGNTVRSNRRSRMNSVQFVGKV